MRAFDVLGPGPPPVPLIVFPFERVLPVEPFAPPVAPDALEMLLPAAPPAPCASVREQLASNMLVINVTIFMA